MNLRFTIGVVMTSVVTALFAAAPHAVAHPYHHVANASAGANLRSGPGGTYPKVGELPNGHAITIICQQPGGSDYGGSTWWDRLDNGAWIHDYLTDTEVYNGPSPGIPRCDQSSPAPPQAATGPGLGDDYPYRAGPMNRVDPWAFYTRNCTSFVAYRMNRDGKPFHNHMRNGWFSHARNWAANATRIGMSVSASPQAGAIAQWAAYERGAGHWGHVAYVHHVNADGSAVIEDYNWRGTGRYAIRTVRAPRYILYR
jgi:surface antigen